MHFVWNKIGLASKICGTVGGEGSLPAHCSLIQHKSVSGNYHVMILDLRLGRALTYQIMCTEWEQE